MKFSIIVVSLNPKGKLNQTLDSILRQTCADFEVIVKDGGSRDGSVENMRKDARIRLFCEKDSGIYDAMNQAILHAAGDFVIFMNCGDMFYDDTVLERTIKFIENEEPKAQKGNLGILYGDTYSIKNDTLIVSPPKIDGFACYRNIPCHQSCFYERALCTQKPYEPKYRIRADYEHFLWCYYVAGARIRNMGFTVASYEGGGFSESRENKAWDKREHREITAKYMAGGELLKYRLIMALTLAPLRSFLAESPWFSGFYNGLKRKLYRRDG